MVMYILAITWIVGGVCGFMLMKKRGIRITMFRNVLISLLGPLSIPLAYMYKE